MMLAFGEGAKCSEYVGVRRRHEYGHLSFGATSAADQARYIVATADIVAGNSAFKEEAYFVRLSSSARFLCYIGQSRAMIAGIGGAYGRIVNALMHDTRFELAAFKWLSAPEGNVRLIAASMLLNVVKRTCELILGARRIVRRRELRNEVVSTSVERLSGLLRQVEQA
jgi:hypothetical protein